MSSWIILPLNENIFLDNDPLSPKLNHVSILFDIVQINSTITKVQPITLVFITKNFDKFFNNGHHMAIDDYQRQILGIEALDTMEEFSDFKEDQIEKFIKNIRNSIPGVPAVIAADGTVDVSTAPEVTTCIILKKITLRLKIERYPINMNYNSVLLNFNVECKALIK